MKTFDLLHSNGHIMMTVDVDVDVKNGQVSSILHEDPADCVDVDCDPSEYNAAIDGIESFILALACEGVDLSKPEFSRALETAVESCANNL